MNRAGIMLEENQTRKNSLGLVGFSILGFILAVDQLIIPMLHIGSFPYKISYFIPLFWFVSFLIVPSKTLSSSFDRSDFYSFAILISIIVVCGILGDFFVGLFTEIDSSSESFKSYTLYAFAIFSFGLGLSSKKFNYQWLVHILFISVLINGLFIFYKAGLPQWLIDFYYPALEVEKLGIDEIDSVQAILELSRPRGMFSNPNGSAFMVNIIALFICVAVQKQLLLLKPNFRSVLIIVLPIVLSTLLASRGEMLAAIFIGFFNYKYIFKSVSIGKKLTYFSFSILVVIGIFFLLLNKIDSEGSITASLDRAYSIFEMFSNSSSEQLDTYEQRNQGVSRPLLMFETAYNRFLHSPIFGTGFNTGTMFPFKHGTQHYHNDWFRLIVTSGLIGLFVMLYIIRKFCIPISHILILPFILPGLVNTFLLNIPVVMFYFFMIAMMRSHLREQNRC